MHPILRIHGHEAGAYAVVLITALAISAVVGLILAPRFALRRRHVASLNIAAVALGLVGAKLGSVVLEGAEALSPEGFTIMGGLLAGTAAVLAVARALHVKVGPVLDLGAIVASLAMAIARVGCLLAGCCWGRPTLFPIALVFRDFNAPVRPIGVPLHATQVYEAAGALVLLAGLLVWKLRHPPAAGTLGLVFVAGYALLRFGLEFLRADPRGAYLIGLSPPQVTCLGLLLVVGVIALVRARVVRRRSAG